MTTKTREEQAAELLAKLNGLFEGEDSLTTIIDRIKELESVSDAFKGIDLRKTLEEIDALKTGHERIKEQIRTSKSGVYIPGIEDEEFSLVRAFTGIRRGRGDWSNVGAAREKEMLDALRDKAAQSIGDDSMGGYFVPDQLIPDVIAAIYTRSVFISLDGEGETLASVISGLSGGTVRVPKFDGGTIAYWIGEEDSYTESAAAVGDMVMNPKKLGVLVKLTDAMQKFGGFGFESLLRRDITRAAAKKLDYAILAGRGGDNEPRGIAAHPDVSLYVAETGATLANNPTAIAAYSGGDWAGGELDFDGLDDMDLILEEDDVEMDASYRTIAPPRYFRRLAQLRTLNFTGQTSGQPYLLGMPMLSAARLAELIGPFSKMNQIATAAKPGDLVDAPSATGTSKFGAVLKGNLSEIVVGRWGGIEIEDDGGRGTGFSTDHTFLKLRMYTDVGIRQPRALLLSPDVQMRD